MNFLSKALSNNKSLKTLVMKILLIISLLFLNNTAFAGERYKDDFLGIFTAKYLSRCGSIVPQTMSGDFGKANAYARKYCDPDMVDFVTWRKLITKSGDDTGEVSNFLEKNYYYPKTSIIQRNLELSLGFSSNHKEIIDFFANREPITNRGKILLANANLHINKKDKKSLDSLREIWLNNVISSKDELAVMSKYKIGATNKDIEEKINRLIWKGKFDDAKRLINSLGNQIDKNKLQLFLVRIALASNSSDAPQKLAQLKDGLIEEEGIIHSKILWYGKNKTGEDIIIKLLKKVPKNSNFALEWIDIRLRYTYEAIKNKDYASAYRISSEHNLDVESGNLSSQHKTKYAQAEWLAGWIALRFLDDPKKAIYHFSHLYDNVSYPVSKARACYWNGRAYAANKDNKEALMWYQRASNYPTTFYGQMALFEYANDREVNLSNYNEPSKGDIKSLVVTDELVKIAYFLYLFNQDNMAYDYLVTAINNRSEVDYIATIVRFGEKILSEDKYADLVKEASYKNVTIVEKSYPILPILTNIENKELVSAIIKQESGFRNSAVSKVGAMGFMQLMPATAKETANKIGIPYSSYRLSMDTQYNVTLGRAYLKGLLDKFDNSYILSVAAYNAGPGSVNRWLRNFGDPRQMKDLHDVIDWIEKITFSETRNYVHRVLEAAVVYNHLFSKKNKKAK